VTHENFCHGIIIIFIVFATIWIVGMKLLALVVVVPNHKDSRVNAFNRHRQKLMR